MAEIYHATLRTPDSSFEAYGYTPDQAHGAVLTAWRDYCAERPGTDPNAVHASDVVLRQHPIARGYRVTSSSTTSADADNPP
jgi:hypothetical protein